MSSEASDWAWRQPVGPAEKLVLLAIADGADFDGSYGGKMPHLSRMTGLGAKAIQVALHELRLAGLVTWSDDGRSKLHLAVRT